MTLDDLMGSFTIQGENQNAMKSSYSGTLELSLNSDLQVVANWQIGEEQTQSGLGFYKDNILVINFKYTGGDGARYYGTVVYKCVTKDVLVGFWSEELGDPAFLGTEKAYRIRSSQKILN
ncbi:hypothetical protein [Nonlabens marinus]|uniref:Uncharacterized protein n=1 Tax=Nonlabens marinus S1-08 TaxID=1454201 RepID=W8VQZ1_9FLAO|nr:hypothetical protein [Nonlabens marinus]BAO55984.1 hypothetical protein NMS_1975 [Nonlabens marinus S1-08]